MKPITIILLLIIAVILIAQVIKVNPRDTLEFKQGYCTALNSSLKDRYCIKNKEVIHTFIR